MNASFQQLHIKVISGAAAHRMAFKKSFLIPMNIKLELFLNSASIIFSLLCSGFVRDKNGL